MKIAEYSFPTRILFGEGAVEKLSIEILENSLKSPLLITDRDLAKLPLIENIQKDLASQGLETAVFSEIWGNPVESQVIEGAEAYREYNSDCVIAIGGGAVMDAAKAILILASHPGKLFEYEDGIENARPIDLPLPYFLAVPTTAGTGSEVGRSAVISDDKTKIKKIIYSPSLLPKAVFADPRLTLRLPVGVTAATGMDALTHCIEAYLAKGFHPICDGIALEGMRLISESIVKCVEFCEQGFPETQEHTSHRGFMLNAAMMGAIAFQKGLGVNHSCAHALSTIYDLHHGLANGVMLPYCMEFNAEAEDAKLKFEIMSQVVGLKDTHPQGFISWLRELKSRLNIPEKLSELNLDASKQEDLIQVAFQDVCHSLNPREVTQEDFSEIFSRAF